MRSDLCNNDQKDKNRIFLLYCFSRQIAKFECKWNGNYATSKLNSWNLYVIKVWKTKVGKKWIAETIAQSPWKSWYLICEMVRKFIKSSFYKCYILLLMNIQNSTFFVKGSNTNFYHLPPKLPGKQQILRWNTSKHLGF